MKFKDLNAKQLEKLNDEEIPPFILTKISDRNFQLTPEISVYYNRSGFIITEKETKIFLTNSEIKLLENIIGILGENEKRYEEIARKQLMGKEEKKDKIENVGKEIITKNDLYRDYDLFPNGIDFIPDEHGFFAPDSLKGFE